MPDNTITLVGNLVADPELRFTQSGVSVANVTIASTPRIYNKQKQEWEDGDALFLRGTVWKDAAENVANSLSKGSRVIATGKLKQRSWEQDGNKRTSIELEIEEIGPSLRYAEASVEKKHSGGSPVAQDPWGSNDESPF